ncbi:acyloxyacyl hydrolase [Ramlibacter sp.]|uniref:acyloxyacyl hydrolase n=1 Tax=Ramlibacter sp. TaxID=1917967 RepID=UPI003D11498B
MNLRHTFHAAAAAVAVLAALPASSLAAPDAWFVEGAVAERGTSALTAGLKWQWDFRRNWGPVAASASGEAFVSHWFHRDVPSGRTGTTSVGVVPLLRLTFDEGRSPWFFEGGIGFVVADKRYTTPDKQFSTRWNFYDVVALGHTFAGGARELSLRVTHTSNASIKRPNPGENFLQLRYAMKF